MPAAMASGSNNIAGAKTVVGLRRATLSTFYVRCHTRALTVVGGLAYAALSAEISRSGPSLLHRVPPSHSYWPTRIHVFHCRTPIASGPVCGEVSHAAR